MSVFRVKLQNTQQGQLDIDPTTGAPFTTSKQRQVYVMGPKRINRLLSDGETFTDCNYWKRFAVPQVSADAAFIEVVSDDGSVYSDVAEENTFVYANSFTLTTDYTDSSTVDFVSLYGSPAMFLQIANTHNTHDLTFELNGDVNATLTLGEGETQIFNAGDIAVTMLRLKGASNGATATVLASVKSAILS